MLTKPAEQSKAKFYNPYYFIIFGSKFKLPSFYHFFTSVKDLEQIIRFMDRLFDIFKQVIKMGGSNDKIKVAIVDEKVGQQTQSDFDCVKQEALFKVTYYKTFQQFLQKQSLKDLSYIIIREDKKNDQEGDQLNLMRLKSANNRLQLQSKFEIKQKTSLKQRFINYIEKYSLQRLVLYLYVDDLLDCRVSQIQMPYFNLISSSLNVIITSIKSRPQREDALNFKFRRLVKNLYRKVTVSILINSVDKAKREELSAKLVQSIQMQAQGKTQQKFRTGELLKSLKQALKAEMITSFDFPQSVQKFQKSLISTLSEYVLINDPHYLTCIMDVKKQYDLDCKIIYLGDEEDIIDKRQNLWMVSKEPKNVATAIKRCTDLVNEKNSIRPQKVIIYTDRTYKKSSNKQQEQNMNILYRNQINFIKEKLQSQNKQKSVQFDYWVRDLKIVFVKSYEQIRKEVCLSVYSYLLTFDCDNDEIQMLKFYIRKNNFQNRIYLYSLQIKKNEGYSQSTLKTGLQSLVTKASFMLKFQITPLESIVLFELGQKQLSFFSNKLGLITQAITEKIWTTLYTKKHLKNIVDNNHIVCSVDGYLGKLRGLIEREIENDNQDYYKNIKIILYDDSKQLINNYQYYKNDKRIAFAHYSRLKIQQFLNVVYVPALKLTIFVKKSLPDFFQSYKNLASSKSKELSFRGLIVSKNELLKEVFDENILNSYDYQLQFRHYSVTNRNSAENLQILNNFMDKYANLWRIGYNITKHIGNQNEKNLLIKKIRDDLIDCLYRCKSYSLLEVSDDQFEYFYIKRLELCNSLLQLQIATIYIVSLPHGFNNILELLFSNPRQGCMIPKIFNVFVVILLSAFCCVEDQVMSNINLSVNIDDSEVQIKVNSLNIGDTIYNTNFVYCGKAQSTEGHCIFIEFENIPMLSQTFIRHYLYVERFSFYKESSEYLIPPYTHFVVRKKVRTAQGKYHIFLHAVSDGDKGFIQKVFSYNQIDHKDLFNIIKQEIYVKENKQMSKLAQQTKSLYKKAEIVGYYEQKKQMIKSIKDGLQYKNFLNAIHSDKNLSALNHLNLKAQKQKQTTEIQALYFKTMLGVQKSLVYYKICEYEQAILELVTVEQFLEGQEGQKWIAKYVKKFRENLEEIALNRQKILNKAPKVKQWTIQAKIKDNTIKQTDKKKKDIVFSLIEKQFTWKVSYIPKRQQFYLENTTKNKQIVYLPYKIKQTYGQSLPAYSLDSIYEMKNKILLLEDQNKTQDYFKYKIDQKKMELHISKYEEANRSSEDLIKGPKSAKIIKNNTHKDKSGKKHHQNELKTQSKQKHHENPIDQAIFNNVIVVQQKIEQLHQIKEFAPFFEFLVKTQGKKNTIQSQQMTSFWQNCGITETSQWQSFYIGDKFILTKKGKHYKAKATSKMT